MDNYHAGLALGILVGVIAASGLLAFLFKKKVLDCHFDERQERARGKAFQYGFFTLLVASYVYAVSDEVFGRWCEVLTGVTLCIAVSMCVFSVTCILKDAYLSLREKPRQVITMFALLSALNLGVGVMQGLHGDLMEDGVLTIRAVNPIIGFATLVILIVYIVKYFLRNREEEAE